MAVRYSSPFIVKYSSRRLSRGTIDHSGVWPQQMVVDFVRVYDFDLGANDSIPPTDPSNLLANISGVTVDLSWDLSTDNEYVKDITSTRIVS